MKKLIFSSLCMLMGLTSMSAQTALQNEILEVPIAPTTIS